MKRRGHHGRTDGVLFTVVHSAEWERCATRRVGSLEKKVCKDG